MEQVATQETSTEQTVTETANGETSTEQTVTAANDETSSDLSQHGSSETQDPTGRPPETVEEQKERILKQVEYYFGEINLSKDVFLNALRNQDPEGYVDLDTICSFKRMLEFQDRELVVEALRGSKGLLEVSEDGKRVRRKPLLLMPIPTEIKKGPLFRSIYVKGFDKDETLASLRKYFNENIGQFKSIKLRTDDQEQFKGSVFVELTSRRLAERALEKKLMYKDRELITMLKFHYCEMKITEKGLDPNTMRIVSPSESHKRGPEENSDDNRPRKKYRKQKFKGQQVKADPESQAEGSEKSNVKTEPGNSFDSHQKKSWAKIYVKSKGAGPHTTWDKIKHTLEDDLKKSSNGFLIRWVYYPLPEGVNEGVSELEARDPNGIIKRLQESEDISFDGVKPSFELLHGEELQAYLEFKSGQTKQLKEERQKRLESARAITASANGIPEVITAARNNQINI